jgi:hypothetical protein
MVDLNGGFFRNKNQEIINRLVFSAAGKDGFFIRK